MSEQPGESSLRGDPASSGADPELVAIQRVMAALAGLEVEQRRRVIDYVVKRVGLDADADPMTSSRQASPSAPMAEAESPDQGTRSGRRGGVKRRAKRGAKGRSKRGTKHQAKGRAKHSVAKGR